eukprot:c22075_g2_i1 orf=3-206(-)
MHFATPPLHHPLIKLPFSHLGNMPTSSIAANSPSPPPSLSECFPRSASLGPQASPNVGPLACSLKQST